MDDQHVDTIQMYRALLEAMEAVHERLQMFSDEMEIMSDAFGAMCAPWRHWATRCRCRQASTK
jgi:hypothetical protein